MDIKFQRGVELKKLNNFNDSINESVKAVNIPGPESANKNVKEL